MPKISKKEIEKDHQMILEELEKNSNRSLNEIAKKLGFSRQKIWRAIKELEKEGMIWGYTAILDDDKQNIKTFIILIKRKTYPINKELSEKITSRKLEQEMEKVDSKMVTSLYTHGAFDWVIIFTTSDIKKANKVSELLRIRYSDYIDQILLIETLFPIKVQNILNPNLKSLEQVLS